VEMCFVATKYSDGLTAPDVTDAGVRINAGRLRGGYPELAVEDDPKSAELDSGVAVWQLPHRAGALELDELQLDASRPMVFADECGSAPELVAARHRHRLRPREQSGSFRGSTR